jgi:GPH family glycoside/pentoside/hexuronide:cation symporter
MSENGRSENIVYRSCAQYGALGVALSFATLPLYIHLPAFYESATSLGLTAIGLLLMTVRLVDMVADPAIGLFSDYYQSYRKTIMFCALPVFALGFLALFNPPLNWDERGIGLWLGMCLVAVYFGYSILAINYYAAGISLARNQHDHTRIALWREAAMLIGVLLASLLPSVFSEILPQESSYRLFGFALVALLFITAPATLSLKFHAAPAQAAPAQAARLLPAGVLRHRNVRWALIIAFLNTFPVAITSTLFLFFVQDVLVAPEHLGTLLAVYFASAVVGMPLWSRLSIRIGKSGSILVAMISAVGFFAWAGTLVEGDVFAFYVICFLSGVTLGADTVLVSSLFADQLETVREESGAAFGWWHFLNKAALAMAAGTMLPLLAYGGYEPSETNSENALALLSIAYAFVPCGCKILAAIVLYKSPLHPHGFYMFSKTGKFGEL